ncbi:MAG: Do family serine endopeptidase [Bauldia sp.]
MTMPTNVPTRLRPRPTRAAALLALGLIAGTAPLALPPGSAVAAAVAVDPVAVPSFADLAEKVAPAVVSVRAREAARTADATGNFFFFGPGGGNPGAGPFGNLPENSPLRRFFDGPNGQPPAARQRTALGSGFFISEDGYVVTNNHVVADASGLTVTTSDGTEYPARLIGRDDKTDVALIKVDAQTPFAYVNWAAEAPRVGDWVVAVGNPFGLGGTVTAGIVSARGRNIGSGPYDDYLQIDAPVNRGNSGGPTFNTRGEVVGINTAIYSPSGGSVGVAFDVPATTAQAIVASLKETGTVVRGWLGVQIQPVTQPIADSLRLAGGAKGALIAEPQPGGPAEAAGIRAGDVVTAVDGKPISNPTDLARAVASYRPDASVTLSLWRDGAAQQLTVRLGTQPADRAAAASPQNRGTAQRPAPAAAGIVGDLGLSVMPSRDGRGLAVVEVDPDGKADTAGLNPGDVILMAGGTGVSTAADLEKALAAARQDGLRAVLLQVRTSQSTGFVAVPVG